MSLKWEDSLKIREVLGLRFSIGRKQAGKATLFRLGAFLRKRKDKKAKETMAQGAAAEAGGVLMKPLQSKGPGDM